MSGSEYQFRNALPLTLPSDTTRKRLSRSVPPSAHAGIQFTPLMCPVKRVGTSATPARGGQIRHGDQPIQHAPIHLVRGRLEVRPGQEEPDRVETARGDPCEIGGDLRAIEV